MIKVKEQNITLLQELSASVQSEVFSAGGFGFLGFPD